MAGANGAGKSSLLQGLLLARQASEASTSYVRLNGPYDLALGQTTDVFCQSAKGFSGVVFEATTDGGESHVWRLDERAKETLILEISERPGAPPIPELTYLNAERIGPRDVLDVESVPSEEP